MVYSINLFDFLSFSYIFVVNLLRCEPFVNLFIGFCVDDSNRSAASIKQKNHIKSLFVSMLHQTYNLRYFKHIMIISCVSLESSIFIINLYVVSFSNVFISLISMFRYKGIIILYQ